MRTAREKDTADLSFKEKKLIEIDGRTRNYTMTRAAFQLPAAPRISPDEFVEQLPPDLRDQFIALPDAAKQSLMMQTAMGELEKQMDMLER